MNIDAINIETTPPLLTDEELRGLRRLTGLLESLQAVEPSDDTKAALSSLYESLAGDVKTLLDMLELEREARQIKSEQNNRWLKQNIEALRERNQLQKMVPFLIEAAALEQRKICLEEADQTEFAMDDWLEVALRDAPQPDRATVVSRAIELLEASQKPKP